MQQTETVICLFKDPCDWWRLSGLHSPRVIYDYRDKQLTNMTTDRSRTNGYRIGCHRGSTETLISVDSSVESKDWMADFLKFNDFERYTKLKE